MKKLAYALLLVTCILALLYGLKYPAVMDYHAYKEHWANILAGRNPWDFEEFTGKDNAYGPVYALFALPFALHVNLPRLIIIFCWMLITIWLTGKLLNADQLSSPWKITLLLTLFASPFLWIRNVIYSQFDIVVALLMLPAIDAAVRGKNLLSGGLISLAIALKYYPLVIVPELAIKAGKPVWRFIGAFLISMVVIYGITVSLWGFTFIKPILAAMERPSKLLSIFQVFRSPFSPLLRWFGIENVDALSIPILIVGMCILTFFLIHRRVDPISGSLLVFILTLLLYKVGHQQFHICLYLLLIYWLMMTPPHRSLTVWASLIYLVFMNIADIAYANTTFLGDWMIVRNLIGIPTFFVLGFLFLAVLTEVKGKNQTDLNENGLA